MKKVLLTALFIILSSSVWSQPNSTESQKEKELIIPFTEVSIILSIMLIIVLSYMYIKYKKRRKENKIKFITLLKKFEEQKEIDNSQEIVPEISKSEPRPVGESLETKDRNECKSELGINSHTEMKILSNLDKFEKKKAYTNKNISISYLAAEFNTNNRYLSYIINNHKNSDFNSYINTLRVNYIISKLIFDEKYRKYKISTLAEESGFSSHSKFTTTFKSITGISPSVFIEFLEEDNQEKLLELIWGKKF